MSKPHRHHAQRAVQADRPAPPAAPAAAPQEKPAPPAPLGLGWRVALLVWLGAILALAAYELVGFVVKLLRG